MKIQIHTYFYGNNYGALLQSLSFKTYLEKKNLNVEFQSYQPKKFLFREEIKPLLKKNPINIYRGVKRFFKFRNWKKKYIKTNPTDFFVKDKVNSKSMSFYGSDEIWNFENPFFGFDPYFFGKSNNSYKCSYAASFGTAASLIDKNFTISKISKLLENFNYISVRDYSSKKFLKKMCNLESEIVLDPIFLIKDDFDHLIENRKNYINKKYCLIYGNFFSKKQTEKIKIFSNERGLKIISLGYINDFADINIIDIYPFTFLNIFKNSEYVFTSMFHGIMFSLKYEKVFWYSVDPYRINKLDYIINLLDLEKRYMDEDNKFDPELDYFSINSKLNLEIKNSQSYIKKCLNNFTNNVSK